MSGDWRGFIARKDNPGTTQNVPVQTTVQVVGFILVANLETAI